MGLLGRVIWPSANSSEGALWHRIRGLGAAGLWDLLAPSVQFPAPLENYWHMRSLRWVQAKPRVCIPAGPRGSPRQRVPQGADAVLVSVFQVIAFICGLIVVALMLMALASTDWLMAAGWRQGLFVHCIAEDAPTPLPFNINDPPDCYPARPDVGELSAPQGQGRFFL